MSEKEPPNPLDELQRQLNDALRQAGGNFGPASGVSPTTPPESESAGPGGADEAPSSESEVLERIRRFNLKPKEIRDYLNRFVIRQDEAKKVLSVAICDHYNHVRQCLEDERTAGQDYHKQNILLLGPTGVGKTYLMRTIAKLIGVPFVKADATKFSETGYVGYDVEDLVRDLNKLANGNTELAQYGIIYIDEIDKIASAANGQGGRDVSGRGVQINLLKLMEEAEVNLFSPTDMMAQMQAMMSMSRGGKEQKRTMSTKHILFIVSGAFDKLAETVKKRVESTSIGFLGDTSSSDRDPAEYLRHVETQDIIKYGFEPEFVGRLPVRVACEPLSTGDLAKILTTSEGNILQQYQLDFRGYDIDFKLTDEAIFEVARRAHSEKTGARGLMTVLERVFRNFKFELPSAGISHFEVSTDTIADPEVALKNLLKEHQHKQHDILAADLEAFAKRFEEDHSLSLTFDEEARRALIDASIEADETIRNLCETRFKDLAYGLKIVSRNTGETHFELDSAFVQDPDAALSALVVASFRKEDEDEPGTDPVEPSSEPDKLT